MNDILDLDVSGLVEDSGDASFPLVTEPLEGEVSWGEIYSHVDGFTKWNFDNDTSSFSATGYEPYLADLRKYNSADFFKAKRGELFEVNEDGERVQVTPEDIIEFVSDIYEKVGIYPIRYYSQAGIDNEISKCINYTPVWSGHNKNVIVAVSSNGSSLCSFFMPNLFKTPSAQEMTPDKEGGESAWDKFYNRKYLEKVVSFCYNYNYKEDSGKIGYPGTNPMSGIRMIGSVPTNFMPMNAKAIYEKFLGEPEVGKDYSDLDSTPVILDFACVDSKTEYFNGVEWKPISEYISSDKVLQYNEDGTASLVYPDEYIKYESDEPFYYYNGKLFNSCLTGDHSIVYRDRLPESKKDNEYTFYGLDDHSETKRVLQKDIIGKDFRGRIPLAFNRSGDVTVTEFVLRAAVMVQADGTIDNFNTGKVRASFTKARKIARFEWLMENLGIGYIKKPIVAGGKSGFYFSFTDTRVTSIFDGYDKTFPSTWYDLAEEYKAVFLDEVFRWDGYEGHEESRHKATKTPTYFSTNKKNAEMVQYLIASTGTGVNFYVDSSKSVKGYKDCYVVSPRTKGAYSAYRGHVNEFIRVFDRNKYCFNVPSHMLVLRREGQIFITGNCGFGGRLLGALSSKRNFRYVGMDPNTESLYNVRRLGEAIVANGITRKKDESTESYLARVKEECDRRFELHCCGSEEFVGPENSVDFAFSSPPYFSLEMYGSDGGDFNNDEQCWKKYPTLDVWLEGYVRKTIKNLYRMLKPGSYYAVNIADFVLGSTLVKYVDDWKRISYEEGFVGYKTRNGDQPIGSDAYGIYLGARARAGASTLGDADGSFKEEVLMVFRKPE